jgi:hypothetical protein
VKSFDVCAVIRCSTFLFHIFWLADKLPESGELQKLISSSFGRKFSTFYAAWTVIAVLKRACFTVLSSQQAHKANLKSIHLYTRINVRFLDSVLYVFLIPSLPTTHPTILTSYWFDRSNRPHIWRRAYITKLLTRPTKFSTTSYYFLPLGLIILVSFKAFNTLKHYQPSASHCRLLYCLNWICWSWAFFM